MATARDTGKRTADGSVVWAIEEPRQFLEATETRAQQILQLANDKLLIVQSLRTFVQTWGRSETLKFLRDLSSAETGDAAGLVVSRVQEDKRKAQDALAAIQAAGGPGGGGAPAVPPAPPR